GIRREGITGCRRGGYGGTGARDLGCGARRFAHARRSRGYRAFGPDKARRKLTPMIRVQRKTHVKLCRRGASLTVIRLISLSPSRNQLRLAHIGRVDIELRMRLPSEVAMIATYYWACLGLLASSSRTEGGRVNTVELAPVCNG